MLALLGGAIAAFVGESQADTRLTTRAALRPTRLTTRVALRRSVVTRVIAAAECERPDGGSLKPCAERGDRGLVTDQPELIRRTPCSAGFPGRRTRGRGDHPCRHAECH